MSITVLVILNYNGRSYLERFLPSIVEHSSAAVNLVVGDNASTDDSSAFLKNNYPQIEVIQLDKNYGFAEGYNQVLKKVRADYYFLLNSDVELRSPWTLLIETMLLDSSIAACQPKILSYNNPGYFEHAGAAGGWMDVLGYPFCRGRILDQFEKDEGQYDQSTKIFWASGAAMLVNASLFHSLGGFDGEYFAHMEEIDWCWRAKKSGYSIQSVPSVSVYHIGGGTLPYNSTRKIFLNFRNNLATIVKNEAALKLLWLIPVRILLDGLAAFMFLFKGHISGFGAILKAYLNLLTWMPSLISKRKHINDLSRGKAFNSNGIFSGSMLLNYFLLGNKNFKQLKLPHA